MIQQHERGFASVIIILVLIGVLALGGGLIYYGQKVQRRTPTLPYPTSSQQATASATLEDISNWKTYINSQYGFTFKYPPNWILEDAVKRVDSTRISIINPDYQNTVTKNGYLPSIQIEINQYELSTGYQENTTIDGIKAYRTSAPSGMQAAHEGVEFKNGGNRYLVDLLYDDGKARKVTYDPGIYNKEAVTIFNQMLSTFHFISLDGLINSFDVSKAKVGDKVGGMTIQSMKPFDAKRGNLSPTNASVMFSGEAQVTGEYYSSNDPNVPYANICFDKLDAGSVQVLPRMLRDDRDVLLCFAVNDTLANNALGPLGSKGTATIVINDYWINNLVPSEVMNLAKLVKVISKK